MLEKKFQSGLIKKIKLRLPGAMVLKQDPNYLQGIPDLLILYGNKWASLEVKKDGYSSHRPNQDYYVNKMNNMSFSSFIYPENEDEVLNKMVLFLTCKQSKNITLRHYGYFKEVI